MASIFPEAIHRHLASTRGDVVAVEPLRGIAAGRVFRVRAARGSVIVKGASREAEAWFYLETAGALAEYGVATPMLEWCEREGDAWWLVLEDIPRPLPRERWLADPAVLAVLRRLHRSGVAPPDAPDTYLPAWDEPMTAAARSTLPREAADRVAPLLERLREAHQHLFAPNCPISGDPNPTNWGLRANGTLVLYDWERVCLGAPALDLAVTIPGLGDPDAFRQVARGYLTTGPQSPDDAAIEALAHDIAVAKAWSVVELLSHVAQGRISPDTPLDWLRERFPGWLQDLACDG